MKVALSSRGEFRFVTLRCPVGAHQYDAKYIFLSSETFHNDE